MCRTYRFVARHDDSRALSILLLLMLLLLLLLLLLRLLLLLQICTAALLECLRRMAGPFATGWWCSERGLVNKDATGNR